MKTKEKEKYYNNLEEAMDKLTTISKNKNISPELLEGIEDLDGDLQELHSYNKKKLILKSNRIYYIELMGKTKQLQGLTKNKGIISNLEFVYNKLEQNKNMLL